MEALRCYRPTQNQLRFHESLASERIIRGGKRSGKTVAAAAEFASAVTGIPILRPDGTPIPRKYPERDLLCWVIGWDLTHIGQTIHKYLFRSGYFDILPNSDGTWRTMNPADPADAERAAERRPAGAMIPDRLVIPDSWGWLDKAENVFRQVQVRSPWGVSMICAYPSTSIQAKQGDAVDLIWIDEDIRFSAHVSEWQDRLSSKKGRLFWSAWPHGTNDALVEMSERAAEQAEDDHPDIMEVVLRFSDNPFIDDNEKRKAVARMRTEEDRRSRDYGEYLLDRVVMYDFIPAKHGIVKILPDDPYSAKFADDPLCKIYTREGEFPYSWTRYLSVDPSHTRTAVLFGVVPPPEYGGYHLGKVLIVENELIAKKASAYDLAKAVREIARDRRYEAFVMDHNMGRQTRVGLGIGSTVMSIYEDAFRRVGLESRASKSSFIPGNNIINSRTSEVRAMMNPDSDGRIRLRFVLDKTYHTQREFGTYRKKTVLDQVLDEPANARIHDAMNAMEYLASYVYNTPEPYVDPATFSTGSVSFKRAQALLAKWRNRDNGVYCHIGPGDTARC